MTDAEKVVKALRGCEWDRIPEHALPLLADFVEAAKATRDDVPPCDCPPEGHYGMCDRQEAFDAALSLLADVLGA